MESLSAKSDILLIGVPAKELFREPHEFTPIDRVNCKGKQYRADRFRTFDLLPGEDVYVNEFSLYEVSTPWKLEDPDIFESIAYTKRITDKSGEAGLFDMGPLETYLGSETRMVVINDNYLSILDTLRAENDRHNLCVFGVMAAGKDSLDYLNGLLENGVDSELGSDFSRALHETAKDWSKKNSKPPVYDIKIEGNRFMVKGLGEFEFKSTLIVRYDVENKQIAGAMYRGCEINVPDIQDEATLLRDLFGQFVRLEMTEKQGRIATD